MFGYHFGSKVSITDMKIVKVDWKLKLWYNSPDVTCMLNGNCGAGILASGCLNEHGIFGISRDIKGLREVINVKLRI